MADPYPRLQRLWRRLPIPRSVRVGVAPALARVLEHRARQRLLARPPASTIAPGPLVVSAFSSDVSGIGKAGRMTLDAISGWGVPVHAHDIRRDPVAEAVPTDLPPGGIWLCHCNPPEVLGIINAGASRLWESRFRIGYWAYELGTLPKSWRSTVGFFHEVWAPTEFVANAIRSAGDYGTTVRIIPHTLKPDFADHIQPSPRSADAPFTFIVMFDARSSLARKNPMGAIRAFQQAFVPADRSVRLVVKIVSSEFEARGIRDLRTMAEGWPNIAFLTDILSDDETLRFMKGADCLVALHRSEGYGLHLAEAMLMGIPVISTGWSGSHEFTTGSGLEVPYSLVQARDPSGRYHNGGQWADPDTASAAALMRQLRDDPDAARRLGAEGRRLVIERCCVTPSPAPYARYLGASGQPAAT